MSRLVSVSNRLWCRGCSRRRGEPAALVWRHAIVEDAVHGETQAVAAESVLVQVGQEIGSDRMNLAIAALAVPDQERESGVCVQPEGQHQRSFGLLDDGALSGRALDRIVRGSSGAPNPEHGQIDHIARKGEIRDTTVMI